MTIKIKTPQFERAAGEPMPACPPSDDHAWADLPMLPDTALRELGLQPWGRQGDESGAETGPKLWLFPGEWYEKIPVGFPVVDLFFRAKRFAPGETSKDIRFGCLAFGILAGVEITDWP